MDKNEYKLRTEEMLRLMEEGSMVEAATIADSIDWRKVRNAVMLSHVGDIYEKTNQLQKSYEVLNLAYERSKSSRKIVYRLCSLAIKTGHVEEALDFYDDFVELAPKDPNQYILKYQILRARRSPIEQQINALENFKRAEYVEKWAYELASLYQEAGMTNECLEECDELILWFSEGKYVSRAMELKMKYKALSPSQQEKYNRRHEQHQLDAVQESDSMYVGGEDMTGDSIASSYTTVEQGLSEISDDDTFVAEEAPKSKISSTMKLDEALQSLLGINKPVEVEDAEAEEPLNPNFVKNQEPDYVKTSTFDKVNESLAFGETHEFATLEDELNDIENVVDLGLIKELADKRQGLNQAPKKRPSPSGVEELISEPFNEEEMKEIATRNLINEAETTVIPSIKEMEPPVDEPEPVPQEVVTPTPAVKPAIEKPAKPVVTQLVKEEPVIQAKVESKRSNIPPVSILPPDIQRMIDEIEGIIPSEPLSSGIADESKDAISEVDDMLASIVNTEEAQPTIEVMEQPVEEVLTPLHDEDLIRELEQGLSQDIGGEISDQLTHDFRTELNADVYEEDTKSFIEELSPEAQELVTAPTEHADNYVEDFSEQLELDLEAGLALDAGEEWVEEPIDELNADVYEDVMSELTSTDEELLELYDESEEPLDDEVVGFDDSQEDIVEDLEESEDYEEFDDLDESEDFEELDDFEELEDSDAFAEDVPPDFEDYEEDSTLDVEERHEEDLVGFTEEYEELDDFEELSDTYVEEEFEEDDNFDDYEEEYDEELLFDEDEDLLIDDADDYIHTDLDDDIEERIEDQTYAEFDEVDDRYVDEPEEVIDIMSSTAPLSRKETAKLHATGKTAPLPLDEISDALSLSDTGFMMRARYDLESQAAIGTRAGLTEEQKKLFSYFVPVRGMSEQLVDVLEQDKNCTNRGGTSRTGNLLIIGSKGSGKTVLAVDVIKAIQKQRNIKQSKVAIVTGEELNKKKIGEVFSKLYGGALVIEKAGKLNEKTVARLNKAMEQPTGELLIVLEEQRKPLDRLLSTNLEFRRKFTSRLEVPVFINDELVTFGQTYANENGYRIDEMGILALYSRIDNLQREDHAVTVSEVKDIMDSAMDYSQKASAKKLVKRVFGKNTDDADRIILSEKDFNN